MQRVSVLLFVAVAVVHGRYYQSPASGYEERMDDYSPVRYYEEVFISEDTDLWGRGGPPVKSGVTPEQIQEILEHHNKLRASEGASNMEILKWNNQLAKLGQDWADRCNFEHGQPPFNEQAVGYKQIGQNIWAHSDPAKKLKDAVQAWFDEKGDFTYDSLACRPGKMCGHYTQVAWGSTREVGCGLTNCSAISGMKLANFLVCNYGPPGNWNGQKPFKKGKPCTGCDSGKFFCTANNLCDYNCNGGSCQCAANCGNCGTKTGDCKCECKPGWSGVACDEECKDKNPKCGANPGWPAMWCNAAHQFVLDGCPKLCKKCKPAEGAKCNLKTGEDTYSDFARGNSFKAELSEFVEKFEGELQRRADEVDVRADSDRYVSDAEASEDKKLADFIRAMKKLSEE